MNTKIISNVLQVTVGGEVPPTSLAASSVSVDLIHRTDALVRGLDLVLEHHGAPKFIRQKLNDQLHVYLDTCSDEVNWLKRVKYTVTYPLAQYLRNELPSPPDKAFEPSGDLRRWMRGRLFCFNRRNTHLWFSWFQAKRSCLPASDDFVMKTYDEHFKTLTEPDCGKDDFIEKIFGSYVFQQVLDRVRDDVTNSYTKKRSLFNTCRASKSACFESTRGLGGSHSHLMRLAGFESKRIPGMHTNDLRSDKEVFRRLDGPHPCWPYQKGMPRGCNLPPDFELDHMSFFPVSYTKAHGRMTNQVYEFRVAPGREYWDKLILLSGRIHHKDAAKCTIQAVIEPLKVRVISKGESLPYYTMKPLQEALHSSLRKMPPFRLIGRPFCPTDLIDLQKHARWTAETRRFKEPMEWFSVDYSGATDGLSWKFSKRILEYVTSGLGNFERKLALKVLGPHDLFYPEDGKPIFRGRQITGQLMGSILSFPILCLANFGLWCQVTKKLHWGLSLDEILETVLVNGDDMIYCAPGQFWEKHIRSGEKVGLKMSIGKSYHHYMYANMNSTSVHFNLRRAFPLETPQQIEYLNTGLFFGQHKVMAQDGLENDDDKLKIGSNIEMLAVSHHGEDVRNGLVPSLNTLLSGSLPGKKSELLRKFMNVNQEALKYECMVETNCLGKKIQIIDLENPSLRKWGTFRTKNLFIPVSLGGMGVVAPPGWKFKVTINQRKAADYILSGFSLVESQRPLGPDVFPLEQLERKVAVPWDKYDILPDDSKERYPSGLKCTPLYLARMLKEAAAKGKGLSFSNFHYPHRCSKSFLRGPGFIPVETRPLVPLMC